VRCANAQHRSSHGILEAAKITVKPLPAKKTSVPEIFVDADACPVKEEIYRVAKRYGYAVTLVSNAMMRIPQADWLKLIVVDGRLDAADDWIVERVSQNDIVISADIPLAARCLEKGAIALDMRGGAFTEDRIGEALASREILGHLRDRGAITGGPAPFDKRDRSRFLQRLDQAIQAIRRKI
jgi:uncharacterized protein YaiI (UPF0178 family)